MKLKYNKPKGQRIRNQNMHIEVEGPVSLWWQHSNSKWAALGGGDYDENSLHSSSHSVGDEKMAKRYAYTKIEKFPTTEKALINYLKRHIELKGYKVYVDTGWVGHSLEVQL